MTTTVAEPGTAEAIGLEDSKPEPIQHIAIIVSKGSLDMVYPGLILANAARMSGIEATMFFTFWGLDAVTEAKVDHLHVPTVGNPSMHIPTMVGGLPGMEAAATAMMKKEMEKLDIPPIPEFIELCADSGVRLFACKASVDMFHLTKDDFIEQLDDIITVGEFYELAAGGQIIFT